METPYFYYISVVKQQIGPVDQEELFEAFASGDLSKDGFVWGGKITDWTKINESYLWSDLKTKFSHLFKAASSSNSHRRLKSFHSRKKSITSTRISASGIGGWAEFLNPDGIPYYYNELTGQTSWDKPKELQAKNELERAGKWIWIPDHLDGFVPAKLLGDLYGGAKEVQLEDGSRKVIDKKTKTYSLNWASLKRNYSDLVLLDELSEPLILHNLRKRFSLDEIYTNIGTILISINPFKPLPLYTPDMMSKYRNRGQKDLPPHVFIIADNSFEKMMETNCSQSIIISGESGAGKTEATKQCLQYLAECAGSETCVEQKILLANPILEAFGNAKTIRNNNSSRFGKYIEVFFDKKYKICGARNSNYLLEKVRVVKQALGERNYHIFFQLCLGASVQHRREFGLGHPSEFRYLSQSGCLEITGVNDAEQFTALEKAMRVLEISEKESHEIFQTIAAILHLGNLEFIDIGDRMCELKQSESLMYTAKLLQVTEGELKNALTTTVLKIRGRDNTAVSLSALEASNNRDALSKFIYDRQFDWLVSRINSSVATCIQKSKLLSVGVLDIFGFEIFERNSFEQLCINLTNEKLQQHFNACTFRLEEELYIHEGICFKPVPYVDNQPILALLESKPNGILSVLDEVLKYPSATDKLLIDELHKRHEKTPHYQKAVKAPNSFIIKHYAGDVEYECFGFLDKNRDTLSEDLIHLVNNSRFQFIRVIIGKSFDDSKSRKTSLGFQFSQQLSDLMKTLNQTQAHYIRCIKPNVDKEPSQFNSSMVMEQLTNSGVFEAVEIRKSGFPFRYSYEKFISRYKPIDPFLKIKSHKEACMELLEKMEVQKHCVQFGATLLLYQAEVHRSIELKRNLAIDKLIRKVQRLTRGWLVRKAVKEYRDIQRLLTLSIEKRNLPELEYLLSTLTNLRYDFKELYQAKQLRVHLQKEIELNTYCERLLSTKDAFECFEEYSKALVAIDEFNLKGDFARDIKKRFNEAKEKYQCIRKLEEGISLMDEKKLESGLIEALALDLVANDAYISALAKLEHIRMEKPLLERLESECQKGGYYDENSQIDSSSLGEAISEYRRFELKTERGLLILRRAEALFDLRKALEKSLDQKDQESWKIVERLVQEHQQILRDDLEFKAAAKQLSHIIAIGELIERLTKSLDPIQYDELKLCLDQVDALALSENEFPVIEEARLLLARAEECQKKAEVAISRPDESLLDEVLFMFEELRFRDPLFEEVKELRDRIYEVKLNAENALKLMVPEQLKAVIDTAGKIKYVNSDVEKIIELLYHTTEEKFVQLQLKAAIALKDEVRITRSTIRLRDIFFSRLGDMFVFKKYPKLLSPAEFANSKGFGFKFNREKIAASFYLHTIQPIHVALTRDLFGQDATDAKTIFKTILCFMGDRENSSDSATLAFSLINKGMNQVNLRAEIYCQLIKQLTNNPTSKSEEKGWQLLSACLDAFPPGSDFENYLEMWIRTNAGSRKDHLLVTFHRSVYFGAKTFPISVNDVIQMLQGHSIRRESSLKGIDLTTNEESLSLQVIKSQGPPPLPISTRLNHTSSPGNMLQYSKSQQAPKPEIPVRPPVLPPRNISKPTSKIISRSPRSPRSPRFNARSGVPSPIRIPQRNKTLQANSRSNLRVPTNPNFNNSLSGSSSFVRNFPAKKRPSFVNPGHLYSESLTSDFQLTINSFIDTKSSVGLDMIWQAAVDPNSGRTYYFNIITREVAWNRPDGYHEPY